MVKKVALSDLDRVELFLRHIAGLVQHPFFRRWQTPGVVNASLVLGVDDVRAESGFDALELETFMVRIRQCVFQNEAFYVDDLQRSVHALLGTNQYFDETCQYLKTSLQHPFRESAIVTYKDNGQPTVHERSYLELLEAYLYTGRIHSERLASVDPTSSTSGWRDAHSFAHADLGFILGTWTMTVVVPDLMNLRRGVYLAWRDRRRCIAVRGLPEFESLITASE